MRIPVRGALSKKVLVQPDLGQCTSGEKSVRYREESRCDLFVYTKAIQIRSLVRCLLSSIPRGASPPLYTKLFSRIGRAAPHRGPL